MISGYDCLNKKRFSSRRKVDSELAATTTSVGSVFQMCGAATAKARLPTVDSLVVGIDWCAAALQVSLNEGGHQLRLYHGVPDASVPFSEACQPGRRVVPGASLLVRLVKTHAAHTPAVSLSFYCSMKPEAQFAKYLTTILRLSYDSAKVTIDLRRTSNLQNILQRAQGFS